MPLWNKLCFLICLFFPLSSIQSQSIFENADSINRSRSIFFWTGSTLLYGSALIGLNETWYKDNPRSDFHFFNDWKEWKNMDKWGHAFSAYSISRFANYGIRWTGADAHKAAWSGAIVGLATLTGIEILDGFSSKWGFSNHDMFFNIIGTSTFLSQQLIWNEQRILLKISSNFQKYSDKEIMAVNSETKSSLEKRAIELFGNRDVERFLKDYNAQTIWFSLNPSSFMPKRQFPDFLNIAFGYSIENVYGGFVNSWQTDGNQFLSNSRRKSEYLIAPDIDFSKIKTNKWLVKTFFQILNIYKIPSPAILWDSNGSFHVKLLYF